MTISGSLATHGYASARPATAPSPGIVARDAQRADPVASAIGSFADVLRQGETTAMAAMTGGADPHALVQALAASELAVETAVTVRDKVVEAYQEILRMPV